MIKMWAQFLADTGWYLFSSVELFATSSLSTANTEFLFCGCTGYHIFSLLQETMCYLLVSAGEKAEVGEFVLWLGGLRTQLVSMRTRVRSLDSLSRLRIQHGMGHRCGSNTALLRLWHRPSSCSSDSIPRLRTSICHGCSPLKKKKRWRLI